jgi:hypothetical protein
MENEFDAPAEAIQSERLGEFIARVLDYHEGSSARRYRLDQWFYHPEYYEKAGIYADVAPGSPTGLYFTMEGHISHVLSQRRLPNGQLSRSGSVEVAVYAHHSKCEAKATGETIQVKGWRGLFGKGALFFVFGYKTYECYRSLGYILKEHPEVWRGIYEGIPIDFDGQTINTHDLAWSALYKWAHEFRKVKEGKKKGKAAAKAPKRQVRAAVG